MWSEKFIPEIEREAIVQCDQKLYPCSWKKSNSSMWTEKIKLKLKEKYFIFRLCIQVANPVLRKPAASVFRWKEGESPLDPSATGWRLGQGKTHRCFPDFSCSAAGGKEPISQTLCSLWRMGSSGMLHRMAVVRTDVSEEPSSSFIRVTRIGELGTTLAATSNRRTLRLSQHQHSHR
jgi:hypothetical protein